MPRYRRTKRLSNALPPKWFVAAGSPGAAFRCARFLGDLRQVAKRAAYLDIGQCWSGWPWPRQPRSQAWTRMRRRCWAKTLANLYGMFRLVRFADRYMLPLGIRRRFDRLGIARISRRRRRWRRGVGVHIRLLKCGAASRPDPQARPAPALRRILARPAGAWGWPATGPRPGARHQGRQDAVAFRRLHWPCVRPRGAPRWWARG